MSTKFKAGDRIKRVHFGDNDGFHIGDIGIVHSIEKGGYLNVILNNGKTSYGNAECNVELVTLKTFDTIQVGDIIVDKVGDEAKVLEVFTNTFLRSCWNNFHNASSLLLKSEAQENSWTIKQDTPVEELSQATKDAMKVLSDNGYEITKKDN